MILRRWSIMNHVLLLSLGLLVLFAWADAEYLRGLKQLDAGDGLLWTVFGDILQPATLITWFAALLAIALAWYVIIRDRSEALALFAVPAILLAFGWEDTLYFFFSPDKLAETIGCYADQIPGVRLVSDLLRESCPSTAALIGANLIGVLVAVFAYTRLQRWKPR